MHLAGPKLTTCANRLAEHWAYEYAWWISNELRKTGECISSNARYSDCFLWLRRKDSEVLQRQV